MQKSAEVTLRSLSRALMLGTAVFGVVGLYTTSATAQNESVTVTGTSIRGQQPVGANVISVDRATIESAGVQTTEQLLATIPQLDNFGGAGQGPQNSFSTTASPTIHSLGNSASNSTLVLIDGHRIPPSGSGYGLIDPSIIPAAATQNVEVLPDGASAIYGSDAIAGVINLHTRKEYSGWETSVQASVADHYNSFNFSQLFGHSWEDGGVLAVYNYSNRSNLMNRERSFISARQDLRRGAADPSLFTGLPAASTYGSSLQTVAPNGQAVPYPSDGGNFQNFACPVATIATASSAATGAYAYPYVGTTIIPRQTSPSGGPGTGICDTSDIESALPSEVRNQALVSMHQALSDRLVANVDLVYSTRLTSTRSSRGAVTNAVAFNPAGGGDTAFGASGSAAALAHVNPFYVGVPGAAANTNREYVTQNFDELLAGQGLGYASSKLNVTTAFTTLGLDYDVGNDWLASLGGTFGTDTTTTANAGSLNSNEALLAINGTTQTGGGAATSAGSSVVSDPYGLNTVVEVTRALTTANALDVWNPAATNRTSPSVLRSLVDSSTYGAATQNFQDVTLHADGPIGDFWGAGQIKAAFGGEYIHHTINTRGTSSSSSGPNSTSANSSTINFARTVYSGYAEFVVPIIGPDMNVPLVQRFVFDIAGRYDYYNDFGETKNPKIAFSWDIIDGIRTSASFGTSFTAPQLINLGDPVTHRNGISGITASNSGASNNLVVLFNDTRPFNNGAGIAGTFVSNPYACAAAGSQPVTDATGNTNATLAAGVWTNAVGCKNVNQNGTGSQGLRFTSGSPFLKPQLGQTYSVNLVFDNFGKFWDVLEGLSTQFTYYQAKFSGAITNIGIITSQTNAGLPNLTTFGPANCTGSGAGTVCTPGWAPSDPVIQNLLVQAPLSDPLPTRIYSVLDNSVQNAYTLWQNGLDFSVNYRLQTDDYGAFTFGLTGNQILRATQQNGAGTVPFDTKNGHNPGRFSDIEFTGRLAINWQMAPYRVGLSLNYQHPYNIANSTFPFNFPGPDRTASKQHIGAQQTVDLSFGYDLPDEWLSGTSLNANINNLFDTDPPYRNNSSGYVGGNVIGRTVTIGIRKKW